MAFKINDINQAKNAVNRVFSGMPVLDEESINRDVTQSGRVPFDIILDDIQPRAVNNYSMFGIEELAGSIERTGLQQPIIVRENPGEGARYVIVAGERRYTAMKYLRDKYQKEKNLVKYDLFSTISGFILDKAESENEEAIYHDTNDFTRQLTNFERILRLDPDMIDMSKESWQEKYLELCFPEKLDDWRNGKYECKGNIQEKCDYICAVISKNEPDIDLTPKTVRNYVSFLERCGDDLKYAILKGKISMHIARDSLSFLPRSEQTLSIAAVGTPEFDKYVKEGTTLAGKTNDAPPKEKPIKTVRQQLDATTKNLMKLRKSWMKDESDRTNMTAKTDAEQKYIDKMNEVFKAIEELEAIRNDMSKKN